jgi:hypothetical protein
MFFSLFFSSVGFGVLLCKARPAIEVVVHGWIGLAD